MSQLFANLRAGQRRVNRHVNAAGQLNRQNRAESSFDASERLQFNVAAKVADIYPNGTLLLQANSMISVGDEQTTLSLSGTCRSEDIGPNNVVLSSNVADLRIIRGESGQVKDSYTRGWLTRILDMMHPF